MVHDHGFDAADAVAQDAEEDSAGGPAEHEDGGGVAGRAMASVARAPMQVVDGGLARQAEELLRHGVEHPAHRANAQHEPLIAVEIPVPGVLRRGVWHEAAIVSELNPGRTWGGLPRPFVGYSESTAEPRSRGGSAENYRILRIESTNQVRKSVILRVFSAAPRLRGERGAGGRITALWLASCSLHLAD